MDRNDKTEQKREQIKEFGLSHANGFEIVSIIGEIEGHENASPNTKVTKYEHILPYLASLEENELVKGVLFLINTIGGDVSCGLALAEMISSLGKPTVSLVLGDSHSIGVPLAVASDYTFITPTATLLIHPVRMSGMVIGSTQTYEQFRMIQDRIISFIERHTKADADTIEAMMMNTQMMAKDLGTMFVGLEAVETGLIQEVGGLKEAMEKLKELSCK